MVLILRITRDLEDKTTKSQLVKSFAYNADTCWRPCSVKDSCGTWDYWHLLSIPPLTGSQHSFQSEESSDDKFTTETQIHIDYSS